MSTLTCMAQYSAKNMRSRISRIKIVLKDHSQIKGILHSATDSSIFVIPNVRKRKEIRDTQFSLKEIKSEEIEYILVKKKGRGALNYWLSTVGALGVGAIVGYSIGGYAIIGATAAALGVGIVVGLVSAIPTRYRINFADRFTKVQMKALGRNSLLIPT